MVNVKVIFVMSSISILLSKYEYLKLEIKINTIVLL